MEGGAEAMICQLCEKFAPAPGGISCDTKFVQAIWANASGGFVLDGFLCDWHVQNMNWTQPPSFPFEKDCECITHDGPHWLHLDALDWARNLELLKSGGVRGFVSEEAQRLGRKADEMERRGLARIPQEAGFQSEGERDAIVLQVVEDRLKGDK
jgi:hypothetical protein